MSSWLYVPVTVHLADTTNQQRQSKDHTRTIQAIGGVYLFNTSTYNYYVIALSTVPHPERFSFKFTCSLMITQTAIHWFRATLCDARSLSEEAHGDFQLSTFLRGITAGDQFKFKPNDMDHLSILSLRLVNTDDDPTRPLFDTSQLSPISFTIPSKIGIPARVVMQCCPFSLTNVAIFSNYSMFGCLNYTINGAAFLSDTKYLDDTIGGVVSLDTPNGKDNSVSSVGLICGSLSKFNGDGELMVIMSWAKIFQLLNYQDLNISTIMEPERRIELVNSDSGISHDVDDPINSCARISVTTQYGQFWGSGIVLHHDTIITNLHVLKLDDLRDLHVYFPNNQSFVLGLNDFQFEKCPLVGFDLCFMRVRTPGIKLPKPVRIANTFYTPLEKGQIVKSIGHGLIYTKNLRELKPFHSEGSINSIISFELDSKSQRESSLLLVSASCWNGSSGGGLFNEDNELIGLMTSNGKLSTGEILPNFTLAIPINIIEKSLFMLKNGMASIDVENKIKDLWSFKNTRDDVIIAHSNFKNYKL